MKPAARFGGLTKLEANASEIQMLRQYLLGQTPEADLSRLEERLMTESNVYQELLILEDELIDQYLCGQLPDPDRTSFEIHFLRTAERHQKVRFAKALQKYADIHEDDRPVQETATRSSFSLWPARNPIAGYVLAAVTVVIVSGAVWLAWKTLSNPVPREPGRVLAVTLTPGLSRDDSEPIKKVLLTPDTDTLRLQLLLPQNQYQSYEAVLSDSLGRIVMSWNKLSAPPTAAGTAVFLDVPASRLPPGDYRLRLNGANTTGGGESVASYSFRIQLQ